MKAYVYDIFHRCEFITDWIPLDCDIALSSTQKVEGKYSIKMTANDNTESFMKYIKNTDWSEFKDIVFSVYHPGWTDEWGLICLYTDMENYTRWAFDFAASWTERTIDLSSAPHSSGGTLDLSNINIIEIIQMNLTTPGEDYYFDFFRGRRETASKMEDTRIHDGIIPYRKFFTFICHPIYHSYFNEENYIDIYDVNEVLSFRGYIKTKSQDKSGIYRFSCPGLANEIFERTYDKSFSSNNTKEKLQDITTNKLEFCFEGTFDATTTDWSYEYDRACIYMFNLARFMERQVPYIEPDGRIMVKDYDGLIATGKSWTLYDNNQNALLIDIPGLRDSVPGYYFGNTGITSVSVRYKDNTTVIRPATPDEVSKTKSLKEFRDPKLQAVTEVNQLGDNLYAIFSKDTIFLGMQIKGEGWLQPGKTIQIENTGQITITQAHFLIMKFVYDPKNDVYINMILSDNIITPDEFKSDLDTSSQQIHTATLQSFENQSDIAENQETFITQHNREIYPTLVIAQDGHTVGVNYVYRQTNVIKHGSNSKTSSKASYWHFTLPSDYVDGQNLTVVLHYIVAGTSRTINYQWLHQYYLANEGLANANTPAGSYTSDPQVNHLNIETSTVTGTLLVAGCHMQIALRIEENTTMIVNVLGIHLIVPVNTRQ